METREFDGFLVVDGQETEPFWLKVLLSTDNGFTSGTGCFALPPALAGVREGTSAIFRTETEEVLTLLLSEIDPAEGLAYFLTLGPVPSASRSRRAS